jgi:hypothetical protein
LLDLPLFIYFPTPGSTTLISASEAVLAQFFQHALLIKSQQMLFISQHPHAPLKYFRRAISILQAHL